MGVDLQNTIVYYGKLFHQCAVARGLIPPARRRAKRRSARTWVAHFIDDPVAVLAEKVRSVIGSEIPIRTVSTDDHRSYHVPSKKLKEELDFSAKHSIQGAVLNLNRGFEEGNIHDPMEGIRYYNIMTMQALDLK